MAKKPSLDDVWGVPSAPPVRPPAAVATSRAVRKKESEKPAASATSSAPAAKKRSSTTQKTAPRTKIEEKPVRMTLYLDPAVANMLDRAQLELKKTTGIRGHAISNSAVIEECVKIVLDHFLKKGDGSQLPSLIIKREAERAQKAKRGST